METKKVYAVMENSAEYAPKQELDRYYTLEEAKEGLKKTKPWWGPDGTGEIYELTIDDLGRTLDKKLVYEKKFAYGKIQETEYNEDVSPLLKSSID